MNIRDLFISKKPQEVRHSEPNDMDSQDSGGFALTFYNNFSSYQSTSLSAVYAAVELISNSIAQLPIHIRDNHGDIIPDHELLSVFKNNIQSKYIMMKLLITDMLINGNGIAYIKRNNGKPVGLIYCPKGSYTISYNDQDGKLTYSIPKVSSKPVLPSDVIHILKNSLDGVNGKGLYYYAQRTLKNANSAEDAANGYYESGCAVNGILKSSKHLSKKQRGDIQEAWNTAHNGTSSMNIPVLPVDLDYIQLSGNAAESQLLESRLFSVQEIARFFNINPVLLGDLSHSSYSTIEAAQLEFLIHTLAPYIELIQDEFNRKLSPNDNVIIDIDEDHILRADKSATSTYLSTLTKSGIISINEARHQLGLEPIEGGDKHYIPFTDLNKNDINKNTNIEENE